MFFIGVHTIHYHGPIRGGVDCLKHREPFVVGYKYSIMRSLQQDRENHLLKTDRLSFSVTSDRSFIGETIAR